MLALGAAIGTGLFILGAVVLVIAAFEWTVRAWSDRATGDPLLTLLAWLRRGAIAETRRRRRLRALGPWRPDRIVQVDTGLVVLSSRDKPDWNERVTIEYRGGFYRLVRREDRAHDRWVDAAHVLRKQQPGELIRRLVTLDDTPVAASDRDTPRSTG